MLAAFMLSGCLSHGYRYCVGYLGASVCVDRPHHHFTNDHSRWNQPRGK